ncbi:hypothetical protein OCGS_0037 [Oceaniovalibus guishaninsula JLT2003]|uniref:DUF1499 domain-containing protein n=1 Tax=Oceaniovalibus guishaninsula JLT2003 TaxID=1231392 RepID=K2GTC8_9RHOB|nr:hypothetical protein OCGS_0037 [Oceaniovalibus guishaninsula JLT2003]
MGRIVISTVAGIILLTGGVALWARSVPVPAATYHAKRDLAGPGDYPSAGGLAVMRDVADPKAAMGDLDARIRATRRTVPLAGSVAEGHASYVTRSRIFGFPDVTNMWVEDGRLALSGHLVVGKSDMGVNADRLRGWLGERP